MKTFCAPAILWVALGVQAIRAQQTPKADDDGVRPPVSSGDLLILKRADQILSSEAVWNRRDTRVCPDKAKKFSLYCALEEASKELGSFEHRSAVMQETRFTIDALKPKNDYEHRLMGYNNDPSTTLADIKRVIRLTEDRIAAKLKDGAKKK
jgi:hypothetical protein